MSAKRIKNYYFEAEGETLTIYLNGVVGYAFDAGSIMEDIAFFGAKKVHFVAFSYGGDVFDAIAVKGFIESKGLYATMEIHGIAASAMTIYASACKEVSISKDAYFMIHRSSNWDGTYDETTEKIDQTLINIYEARTGLDRQRIADMMEADTHLNAQEALELGFVDRIIEPLAIAAQKRKIAELSISNMSETKEAVNTAPEDKQEAGLLARAIEAVAALGKKNEATTEESTEEEEAVATLVSDNKELSEENEGLKEDKATLEQENSTLSETVETITNELEGYKAQIAAQGELIEKANKAIEELMSLPAVKAHVKSADGSEKITNEVKETGKPQSRFEQVQARLTKKQ